MSRNLLLSVPIAAGLLAAVGNSQTLTTELVASGLASPLYLTSPPNDPGNRLFVLEQSSARIRIVENGAVLPAPFLDINPLASGGGERGLLGLAFHPDYASNGLFFVNYTNNSGNTVVAKYSVAGDPLTSNTADLASGDIILTINQPFSNHNGGCIQFGVDGFLYVATGDGGAANDPGNRAQTITNQLLGKMLRLDVDGDDFPADTNKDYAIPPSNPFVGITGDDEIWQYGLRNPWRFSFDRVTNDMWIGDVGQGAREEVNFQAAASDGGENWGWRCMEGMNCTGLSGCTCNAASLELPIHEYDHGGGRCSITGGYVYRGSAIPGLDGTYFFADYCSSQIWSFRYDGVNMTEFTERTGELSTMVGLITSFGEDAEGNLYIIAAAGQIVKIVEACDGTATNYCVSTPNSQTGGAVMNHAGSLELSDNNFTLVATGGIPTSFGLFLYGENQVATPLGDGIQCVGPGFHGLLRLPPPGPSNFFGDATRMINLPTTPILPGVTWNFQYWYRDAAGGPSGFNLSDGLEVVFCP